MKLRSFRDGEEFEVQKPNVDGLIEIMEATGSRGLLIKTIARVILERSFDDVTLEEIGLLELGDLSMLLRLWLGREGETYDEKLERQLKLLHELKTEEGL